MKLSIIVPIYNAEKVLGRCIQSILNQTYTNFELILINDGSKDSSIEIANQFAVQDNRIIVIDKLNEGVSKTRNLGMQKATGELIAFVDADDFLEPTMYEKLMESQMQNDSDIVFCKFKNYYSDDKIEYVDEVNLKKLENPKDIQCFFNTTKTVQLGVVVSQNIMGVPWRSLFLKSIIQKYSLQFDANFYLAEDLVFILEYLSFCNKVSIVEEYLYNYYVGEQTASRSYRKNFFEYKKQLNDRIFSVIQKNEYLSDCQKNNCILKINASTIMAVVLHAMNKEENPSKYFKSLYDNEYYKAITAKQVLKQVCKKPPIFKKRVLCFCIKHRLWGVIKRFASHSSIQ